MILMGTGINCSLSVRRINNEGHIALTATLGFAAFIAQRRKNNEFLSN